MQNPPIGAITFLFTDIEGSIKRWEQYPAAMQSALARHGALLREAIEAAGGYVFKTIGAAFCATFAFPYRCRASSAHHAKKAQAEKWPVEIGEIRVRMALHFE